MTAMANYLGQTMSPQRDVRKGAEDFLRSVEVQQGYPILLLTLLQRENVDIAICRHKFAWGSSCSAIRAKRMVV